MDISVFVWPMLIPSIIIVVVLGLAFLVLIILQKSEPEEELLPYKVKQYLFSRSEHEFLKILHKQLDATRFLIFPKVRLADFFEVTASKEEYQKWWNKIRSKHVDYLVWDVEKNKIAVAIELDGKSHNSDKVRERDVFVNRLYSEAGLRLERVKVGSDFGTQISNIVTQLKS